ncbi:MAG TPA: aromatic amino acid ammonia-lyase [Candidatus Binatia bacterium]|nr:aromatic amino acid ammonia-lyase [Candidatus Binatia bacterium]
MNDETRSSQKIAISGSGLTIPQVAVVARDKNAVQLTEDRDVRQKISASRELLEEKLRLGEIIYGVNTGLGGNVRFILPAKDIAAHQENIFRFLICGTGNPLPEDAVRAAMLLRANALAKGYSAVRVIVIERLLDLLNHEITPVVPTYGSVGASGDLIPSAYIGRALLSQGEVLFRGKKIAARTALERARLQPLTLEPKEGLALINGTTVMSGIAALQIHDGAYLCRLVLAACGLALEGLNSTDDPFREAIQAAKNHPGQIEAAAFCRKLIEGSRYVRNLDEIRGKIGKGYQQSQGTISRSNESIQTPYSLRCIPQGIGPMLEAVRAHQVVIEREINSANDNPLVDPVQGRVYHTGNFYGGHVARALDSWKIDLTTLGNWLHALIAMVVDDRFNNGLPPNLAPKPGLFSGFKGMQLCLTSLVCALRQSANPSMIHTLPTEQYNQDMVSLGMHSAVTAMQMTTMLHDAVAIALITLCQAIDLRGGRKGLGHGTLSVYERLRSEVPFLEEDRPLDMDIRKVTGLIQKRLIPLPEL